MAIISRKEITVPNILTLLRMLMALAAAALILGGGNTALAAGMLIIASVLDYFDGWYARKFHQKTKLGAHLDPFADKVLISVIFLILAGLFRWPWFSFFVAVILAREILITLYRMIMRRKTGALLPASRLGKIKTTIQCLAGDSMVFFIFIYPARVPERNWIIFSVMAVTMFITVDSGLRYLLPKCSDGKKRSVLERIVQWIFAAGVREV